MAQSFKSESEKSGRELPHAVRKPISSMCQIATEQLVGAFSAQTYRRLGFAQFREKPDRQRAGVSAGLVGVVSELFDRALEIFIRSQIKLFMIGPIVLDDLLNIAGFIKTASMER